MWTVKHSLHASLLPGYKKKSGLLCLWWKLIAMVEVEEDKGMETTQGDIGCFKTNPFNSSGRWSTSHIPVNTLLQVI